MRNAAAIRCTPIASASAAMTAAHQISSCTRSSSRPGSPADSPCETRLGTSCKAAGGSPRRAGFGQVRVPACAGDGLGESLREPHGVAGSFRSLASVPRVTPQVSVGLVVPCAGAGAPPLVRRVPLAAQRAVFMAGRRRLARPRAGRPWRSRCRPGRTCWARRARGRRRTGSRRSRRPTGRGTCGPAGRRPQPTCRLGSAPKTDARSVSTFLAAFSAVPAATPERTRSGGHTLSRGHVQVAAAHHHWRRGRAASSSSGWPRCQPTTPGPSVSTRTAPES
jgi:hypothetical protein